ncbi:MAG: 3-oxoacyl-ACP synthase [Trueperaceae bacterium]|nr:3-oxoacyl-ACP synthase [Trueperaceae bacterium]
MSAPSRTSVGVTGLATYVPAGRLSAADLATATGLPEWVVRDKLGIEERVLPGPDDHPVAMGVTAGERALADAGVRPEDVDVVISMTEEYKEYPVWTAGIKLAYDVGARNAYAYDVGQKCGTAVLALKQAKDLLLADESVNVVLVAGGYRNSDLIDLTDPDVRFMYNLGAGAGAAVVQHGAGHRLLGSSIITDGSFSLDVLVPVGGTKAPLTPANVSDYRLRVPDPAGMKERLEHASLANFVRVVREALERSGAEPADLAYLAMLHVKRSAHDYLLRELGLAPEQSTYLSRYGHLGQVDQILSLELARASGRLRPGDLAVAVAAGVGYVWNAVALRWSEEGAA